MKHIVPAGSYHPLFLSGTRTGLDERRTMLCSMREGIKLLSNLFWPYFYCEEDKKGIWVKSEGIDKGLLDIGQ